jgi:hypothetical protein
VSRGWGDVAGRLDGDAVLLCEREEGFGSFFRCQGQVDVFSGERSLVGAADQQQCFGEVDRSGVDGAEAFVELAVVAVRLPAGDIEEVLRDLPGRPGCLDWRHDLQRTGTSDDSSDSQGRWRRPAGRLGDPLLPSGTRCCRPRRPHHPSTSFALSPQGFALSPQGFAMRPQGLAVGTVVRGRS